MSEPKLTGASQLLSRDEIYLIGLFIVVWNEAEALLKFATMIQLKSNLPEIHQIMSGYSIVAKADIFSTVIEQRCTDSSLKEEAAQCAKSLKSMADFRNNVAHGFWMLNESTKKPDAQNNVFAKTSITIEQIRGNYESLRVLVVRLGRLIARLKGFPLPADAIQPPKT